MSFRHVLADLYGVSPSLLKDDQRLLTMLQQALRDAGFTVLNQLVHTFPEPGGGVTGVVLLAESHAAFHTYPEFEYLSMDVFSCGIPDPDQVVDAMVSHLAPTKVQRHRKNRGQDCRPQSPSAGDVRTAGIADEPT